MENYSIIDFQEEVVAQLVDYLPANMTGTKAKAKNKVDINGDVLYGVAVDKPDTKVNPIIYLNDYFNGSEPTADQLESIAEKIVKAYRSAPAIDTTSLMDFDVVKDKFLLRVVNAAGNIGAFSEGKILYKQVFDLLLYVVVDLGYLNGGYASFKVMNQHLDMWDVSAEEVYRIATENTERSAVVKTMLETLMEIDPAMGAMVGGEEIPMIVAQNTNRNGGAAVMFCPGVQARFAELLGTTNIAIIPSSIHEVIAVPNEMGFMTLASMIKEVNGTQLAPNEILSDHPYILKNGRISSVPSEEDER